ncbi:DUF2971 domain-containing protein [Pedobacter mendelii]|uniref:DUF2971 domain-containing protein n=1 Tax=Pedobacter mendelii TaxID=1908240 RepID=A0ABQ2BJI8_9SPHI|nr:DUF2971 domain-containing protein [Pedobacter mendelii]GGI27729.1 hypothetical protein GCM10008119_29100 [Pedobacter mendelii]
MERDEITIISDDGNSVIINRNLSRYSRIDEHLLDSLSNNYLWFSNPLDFNDPYDCNLGLQSDCSFIDLFRYLISENISNNWNKSIAFIANRSQELFENPLKRLALLKETDKNTVSKIGICCFSERADSLLMWSHYGSKHTGICLSFDITKDPDLFSRLLYKVEYPNRYPIYNWPNDKGKFQLFRLLVATKSKEWEYESEIRLVRENLVFPWRGKVNFKRKALVSIKFGYNSSEPDRHKVQQLVRKIDGYDNVKFYVAKLKEKEFGVEYEEI